MKISTKFLVWYFIFTIVLAIVLTIGTSEILPIQYKDITKISMENDHIRNLSENAFIKNGKITEFEYIRIRITYIFTRRNP